VRKFSTLAQSPSKILGSLPISLSKSWPLAGFPPPPGFAGSPPPPAPGLTGSGGFPSGGCPVSGGGPPPCGSPPPNLPPPPRRFLMVFAKALPPAGTPAPRAHPNELVEVRVVVAAICDILAASEDNPSMESIWGLVMCVGMS
jgi:hypothetical protein